MDVDSVDERFGADIVVTSNVLTDEHGELVLEAFTTLMGHEGDNSISAEVGSGNRPGRAHGRRSGRATLRAKRISNSHLRRCTLGPRGFPN